MNADSWQSIQRDAELDPSIQFELPRSQAGANPRAIVLTGATGFLGAFLLGELLRTTSAQVYCLIRSANQAEGQQRLAQRLQDFALWQPEYASRIIAVSGDLGQPLWGLTENQFHTLAEQVEVVYHSGAWVNSVYPYSKLCATNVQGTQTALRLASLERTKPFHFISTLAVFFGDTLNERTVLSETDIPPVDPSLRGGYKLSKWVADCMVRNAITRGLPAVIYRPARITGHSTSGLLGETNDLLTTLLKGCILLGSYPDLEIDVPMVPVDYIARAVGYLSQAETSFGKAFHFYNAPAIRWNDLWAIIRDLGYPMRQINYVQWQQELEAYKSYGDSKPLFVTLKMLLQAPNNLFFKRPIFDESQTRMGLAGSGIHCPPVNETLIANYLGYFQRTGYLPLPAPTSG